MTLTRPLQSKSSSFVESHEHSTILIRGQVFRQGRLPNAAENMHLVFVQKSNAPERLRVRKLGTVAASLKGGECFVLIV